MNVTPKYEPDAVRQAVLASTVSGTVSDELVLLIQNMAARRCSPTLSEDVAQDTLVVIVRVLPRLDPGGDTYAYVGRVLVNAWRHILRKQRRDTRCLKHLMADILDDIPSSHRPGASGKARASMHLVLRQKYYA